MNNILNSLYQKLIEINDIGKKALSKSDFGNLQRNSDVIEYDENGNFVRVRRKKKGKCLII